MKQSDLTSGQQFLTSDLLQNLFCIEEEEEEKTAANLIYVETSSIPEIFSVKPKRSPRDIPSVFEPYPLFVNHQMIFVLVIDSYGDWNVK